MSVLASPGRRVGRPGDRRRPARLVSMGQGLAYVATGAWPLLSMRSFEAVTGPKRDDWLDRTVGALTVVIGAGLLAGRDRPGLVRPFGAGGALVFLSVDLIGVGSGRLSRVYLLDAAFEAMFLAGWGATSMMGRRRLAR